MPILYFSKQTYIQDSCFILEETIKELRKLRRAIFNANLIFQQTNLYTGFPFYFGRNHWGVKENLEEPFPISI